VKFSSAEVSIIIHCTIDENEHLNLSIKNYGSFIPKEKQDYIFEKFGQLKTHQKNKYSSTGLGLTFCRLAVKAHNGAIGVYSSEQNETTFWFTLPDVSLVNKENTSEISNKSEISLSKKDKKDLSRVYKNLKNLNVSEIEPFTDIFTIIERDSLGNKEWITALENSIYNCDESAYKQLVQMIIE
jgi:hypothetical protein